MERIMPARKLKKFLDENDVKYMSFVHSPAYSAQEVAASVRIAGKELAKTVIIKIDDKFAMAVLPANRKVVLQDLRDLAGTEHVTFATENEFKSLFPDCEIGAMPPFGNLYGMDVFVSPTLQQNEEIA